VISVRAGAASDVGRVREINEDRYLVADRVFAVCDGLGGHQAGEVASATAVETLREAFSEPTLDCLLEAVRNANRAVWQLAQDQPDKRGMGTTLTAVAVVESDDEEQLAVVNVGDSRGYLLRDGELTQLTEDHSLVAEMERDGRLTHEEALVHPQRAVITRALGLDPEVEVDYLELLPYRGDRLLLCTDGLTNELTDDAVGSTLRRLADPDEAAKDLVGQARASGGSDNITVVVIDIAEDDGKAEQASAALAGTDTTESTRRHEVIVEEGEEPAGEGARAEHPGRGRARRGRTGAETRPRRVTWRVAVFVLLVLAVLGGAATAINWYARHTFYVGLEGDQVAIFRGRPGGLLWFDPTLEQRFSLTTADVPASRVRDLREGKVESSKADAHRYVNNLRQEAARARAAGASNAPPPTSTSAP
jgi:serine/threonine protein phosphatase PrpC